MRKFVGWSILGLIAAFGGYYSLQLRSEWEGSTLSSLAPAAGGKSVTATASATVISALAVTSQTPLHFGTITRADSSGTITITTDNRIVVHGHIQTPKDKNNTFRRAEFSIQGLPGKEYRIHLPDELFFTRKESTPKQNERGQTRLRVNDFRSQSVTAQRDHHSSKLDKKGQDTVYVGGTLHVPAHAAPGTYSGSVPMTVEY